MKYFNSMFIFNVSIEIKQSKEMKVTSCFTFKSHNAFHTRWWCHHPVHDAIMQLACPKFYVICVLITHTQGYFVYMYIQCDGGQFCGEGDRNARRKPSTFGILLTNFPTFGEQIWTEY